MRLAVVGSREFNDYEFMKKILEHYPCTQIISGGAKGADSLAKQYSAEKGILLKEFLPNWDVYGKSAGFIRNKRIVAASDEVVAFWDGESKGTKHTIDIAEESGKPVHIYWPPPDKDEDITEGVGV